MLSETEEASPKCSRFLQERPIERGENQDNSHVNYQPLEGVVPEEQNVYANDDSYQREYVQHDGWPCSH